MIQAMLPIETRLVRPQRHHPIPYGDHHKERSLKQRAAVRINAKLQDGESANSQHQQQW